MMERINTARFNEMTEIDGLSASQLDAVRKLRKKAGARGLSVYTLGVLDTRDNAKLVRLSEGKRLIRLSPATREILIQEVRECVYPHNVSVVAVWSAWCEANNVVPEETPDVVPPPVTAVPDVAAPKKSKRVMHMDARQHAPGMLRDLLADGQEHDFNEILAAMKPYAGRTILYEVATELGVTRRWASVIGQGRGRRNMMWSLPQGAEEGPRPVRISQAATNPLDVPLRSPKHLSSQLRRKSEQALAELADECRVSGSTLARWCEMVTSNNGTLYGVRKLPDRESDEGLELAERVYEVTHPRSPTAVAWEMTRHGGKAPS